MIFSVALGRLQQSDDGNDYTGRRMGTLCRKDDKDRVKTDLEKKLEAELEIFSIAANVWCGETRPSEFPPYC